MLGGSPLPTTKSHLSPAPAGLGTTGQISLAATQVIASNNTKPSNSVRNEVIFPSPSNQPQVVSERDALRARIRALGAGPRAVIAHWLALMRARMAAKK